MLNAAPPALGYVPSELEILDMMTTERENISKMTASDSQLERSRQNDPWNRYLPEPSCPEGCRECKRGQGEEIIASENVEWARIAFQMKSPKWVFDGRGLVDVVEMEKLGFRVEVIGKAGSRSRLDGKLLFGTIDTIKRA
jgi:UDPglucose 6-dehydrogenase